MLGTTRPPLAERWLDLGGGRRLRYLVGGNGPSLLLCHGFLGSAENFAAWFPDICRSRTVVACDLAGFGETTPLPGRHTTEALADDVCSLLDHLGWRRFDLGGLCLGCSVAMDVLRRLPERVDKLLLHTPLLAPSVVRRPFRIQVAALTAPGVFPVVAWLSRRRLVSDLYKRLVVEGPDVDPQAAEMNFRNQLRAHPRAAREWLRDGVSRDDLSVLARDGRRTLILVPDGDRIVDVDELCRLVRSLVGVEVAVVTDAGHGWTEEVVRRQLAVVLAFLEGRPLPEGSVVSAA